MIKNKSKKFGISFLILFLVLQFYPLAEYAYGAVATDDVIVTLTVTSGISITSPADVALALSQATNTSVGSAIWNVKTNNAAGYTLTVHASTAPAMARSGGGGNVVDYTPLVVETPETWTVPSGSVEFGFSARGTDVNTTTYGTDTDCIAGAGVPSAALKWRDFDLTASADQIATLGTKTTTAGVDTEMCVAVEQKDIYADSGTYTATITATATTL